MSFLRVLSGVGLLIAGARAIHEGTSRQRDEVPGSLPGGAGMNASLQGVRSLDDRMRILVRLIREGRVDPVVREWSAKVLARRCGDDWCVREKDRANEIKAIFDALRRQVRYTGDTWSNDTFSAARHTLRLGIGDCDDSVITGCSALETVGIRTRCVVIQTVDGADWDHIYLEADDGAGGWVPFDASVPKPCGWAAPASMVKRRRVFST